MCSHCVFVCVCVCACAVTVCLCVHVCVCVCVWGGGGGGYLYLYGAVVVVPVFVWGGMDFHSVTGDSVTATITGSAFTVPLFTIAMSCMSFYNLVYLEILLRDEI